MTTLGGMQYRPLGRTGVSVSMLGLGGSHIGSPKLSRKQAVKIIRAALDGGLSFMDSAWDYHGGESERRLGQALKSGYRERAFVMTKIDGRTKKEATAQLDQSLKRLGLERIDLIQHHEVIRFDDVDRIFAPGGAAEALEAARIAGKVRFIGFTGHKHPAVHLYMLEVAKKHGFRFDTVQMPLNLLDTHYRSFEKQVLPVLVRDRVGVLGMKSMGSGVILKSKALEAVDCLSYALSLPTSVVITGIDSMKVLRQAFEVAQTFQPLSKQRMAELRAASKPFAEDGAFELFKTTSIFDSTAQNPEWLGNNSARTKQLVGS